MQLKLKTEVLAEPRGGVMRWSARMSVPMVMMVFSGWRRRS